MEVTDIVFQEVGSIAVFLIVASLVHVFLGEKILFYLLILLLLSQVTINWNIINSKIRGL